MNLDVNSLTEQMPDFQSHKEARDWFKGQLQNQFLLRSEDTVNGKRVYYYHIVKNKETYQQYMQSFASEEGHQITNADTFKSYSTVEISEDGDVSISI
ncbi:hypothetical protein M3181_08485 [Mesobacillus maritimus]|uniref:hypothetical protein n=1 Tax=Mesobacillus maritimus TaxID=1643336 RepID=UPI00203B7F92|nr:hypothetical protein [Mesobacillus maritimus]MCM3669036.1 hypothetical protein [Mesobacillus maritimus]